MSCLETPWLRDVLSVDEDGQHIIFRIAYRVLFLEIFSDYVQLHDSLLNSQNNRDPF